MPAIIGAVAPGFAGHPQKFADAIGFSRIMFPFVAIILVVAVFTGTLNAMGRYAIAAWAPVLLNLLLIGALLYAMAAGLRGSREAGFVLVWTVLGAGLLNLLIVAVTVWYAGYRIVPRLPLFDADLRRLMLIALPGIAIAGAGHINVVIAAQISSATPQFIQRTTTQSHATSHSHIAFFSVLVTNSNQPSELHPTDRKRERERDSQ